jgi:NAD(P)-dependent dehydrogenase (short-subunit alcohol dehydrogenase family)
MGVLDGKVAVVTGGGSGIGKAIAAAYAREGCSVVIASRDAAKLNQAAKEIQAAATGGAKVVAIPADATDEKQVVALFGKVMQQFKRLDVLVNNAGAFGGGRMDTLTLEKWKSMMDVNVTGAFLCLREAFKIMKDAGGGRIINIGSIAAQRPRHYSAPYTTSKFAIWGLTNAAALDGREFGIAVSCLHPGNTEVERRSDSRSATGRDEGPEPMISRDPIARTAVLMATMPPEANMLEAIVLPIKQTYLGRG